MTAPVGVSSLSHCYSALSQKLRLMHALEKTLIKTELRQRREEGCDVAAIEHQVAQAFAEEAPNTTFNARYDDLMALPIEASFPYD